MSVYKVPFAAAIILLVGGATAAVVLNESPGPVMLYKPDGTSEVFKTYAECLAAAPAAAEPGARSRCTVVTNITKVGTCDPAEPPDLPVEQEGLTVQCPTNPLRYFIRATGYEREPFPSCQFKLAMLPKDADPPYCHAVPVNAWTRDDPENIAPDPAVDPEFDEFSPEGPGPGPPGAVTADHPDIPG